MTRLTVHGIAKGGDGVARDHDGRVVFIRGALPGDEVEVRVVEERKRHAHAELVTVLAPGPGRTQPRCLHVAEGCGGCDFQHATLETQRELKLQIVRDALERIGGIAADCVVSGGGLAATAYRTSVRCGIDDDRAGFRLHHRNDVVATPDCLVVHPDIAKIMAEGRFPGVDEVMIRVGARTGDRVVVATPRAGRATAAGAPVVGADEIAAGGAGVIHEMAAGRRWRVSAGSFFQPSPEAAELLVDEVGRMLGPVDPAARLCDLYGGVGLFAGALGHPGPVTLVETSADAIADARHNLADLDVDVEHTSVAQWSPVRAAAVVADPSRQGLGRPAVGVIAATGAAVVVLVSCDPAAFARDASLLVEHGFRLDDVVVLDLFPQTSHVEVVSLFVR